MVPVCVGQQLIDADPLQNVVLSAHTYWAGVDHTHTINDAVALNLPRMMKNAAGLHKKDVHMPRGDG